MKPKNKSKEEYKEIPPDNFDLDYLRACIEVDIFDELYKRPPMATIFYLHENSLGKEIEKYSGYMDKIKAIILDAETISVLEF